MAPYEEVHEMLSIIDAAPYPPRYNIAPTQPILMVVAGPPREPGSNLPERRSLLVRWGLIPGWAKDPKDLPLLINARSETAAEKAAFRAATRHRRALIPASGFFEWKRNGKQKSQAYFIRPRGGGLMAFGGLMETWSEPGGSEMDTGAILTTAANDEMAAIHDRMPVIIQPRDFERWLDCRNNEPRDVADLMRPLDPGFLEAIPISDKVNKVANATPDILDPVEPEAGTPKVEQAPAEPASDDQMKLF